MDISDFLILDGFGDEVQADISKDILATTCSYCGHPLLFIAKENGQGIDEDHPIKCKGCDEAFFLDIRERMEKLIIFSVTELNNCSL